MRSSGDSARSVIPLARYRSSMVNARFVCANAVVAMNVAIRKTARFMARMLSSYSSALHGLAVTAVRRLGGHVRDAAHVDADRRQDPPDEDALDQPLVERRPLRDSLRPRHLDDSQ